MIYLIIIMIIFGADYLIKGYIEKYYSFQKKREFLKGNIIIHKLHNRGACMNLLEKKPSRVRTISGILIVMIAIVFLVFLPRKGYTLLKTGLAMVLGGAFNNMWDRIDKGYVVDYFSLKPWKRIVFNISDFCIFIGSFIILISGNKK